jgi:hypothetical protein
MRRVVSRAPEHAKRAQGYIDRVLKLEGRIGSEAPDPSLEAAYRDAIGAAMFLRTERDFEAFIADGTQRPLDRARVLVEAYARIKRSRSPYWVLAASYRAAVALVHTAQVLDAHDCDLATVASRMAAEAFEYCLSRATEFRFFSDDARRCEAAMHQTDPDAFPALRELVGTATYDGDRRMHSVGVVTDWADVEPYYAAQGPATSPHR